MEAKEEGVDATMFLCSSGLMWAGSSVMNVKGAMVDFVEFCSAARACRQLNALVAAAVISAVTSRTYVMICHADVTTAAVLAEPLRPSLDDRLGRQVGQAVLHLPSSLLSSLPLPLTSQFLHT